MNDTVQRDTMASWWIARAATLAVCLLVLLSAPASNAARDVWANRVEHYEDGTIDRVYFKRGRIFGSEEVVVNSEQVRSITFRQISDGEDLVMLIYAGTELEDCDIVTDRGRIAQLRRTIMQEQRQAAAWNRTQINHDGNRELTQMHRLQTDCHILHEKLRRELRAHQDEQHERDLYDEDEDANEDEEMVAEEQEQETQARNNREEVKSRKPRDVGGLNSYFIYPGTKWCGRGSVAKDFQELGEHEEVDRCCRTHDYCDNYIEGFTWKYCLFNHKFHTLSECECDRKFRTCLKRTNSSVATMIHRLYFEVVSTECFIVQPVKSCRTRSWWGYCQEEFQENCAVTMALSDFEMNDKPRRP